MGVISHIDGLAFAQDLIQKVFVLVAHDQYSIFMLFEKLIQPFGCCWSIIGVDSHRKFRVFFDDVGF